MTLQNQSYVTVTVGSKLSASVLNMEYFECIHIQKYAKNSVYYHQKPFDGRHIGDVKKVVQYMLTGVTNCLQFVVKIIVVEEEKKHCGSVQYTYCAVC